MSSSIKNSNVSRQDQSEDLKTRENIEERRSSFETRMRNYEGVRNEILKELNNLIYDDESRVSLSPEAVSLLDVTTRSVGTIEFKNTPQSAPVNKGRGFLSSLKKINKSSSIKNKPDICVF